jgi:type I phosphodiesterase/nucleotide pyrophosphatase
VSDRRVDDLRQQLRSLGYLDAGVDRFVLGPAQEQRRPAAIALLSSLRVGLLAALLLGPAAAIGIGGRLPGLVTGWRDAVVIAAYLAVIFGTAVTLVAFGASLLLASVSRATIARRPRAVAAAGGVAVTVACLIYLTMWWRIANPGAVWSSPMWTAVALTVAVIISLLLGHAISVTALAVLMARERAPGDRPALRVSPGSYWKLSLVSGVIAFAGAAMLLLATTPGDTREPRTPALTVVSTGYRVRVIAIDGFDERVFAALSAAGRVPALAAALGGSRAQLTAADASDPARTWTTIATGQPAEIHGVLGLETRRVAGVEGAVTSAAPSALARAVQGATDLVRLTRPAIVSGSERRSKTLWEIAAESGLRTTVVNWWATWPAPVHSSATIVTDRAVLRLERGGPLDAEIAPASVYEQLRGRWTEIHARAADRTRTLPDAELQAVDPAVRSAIQRSAELDALQLTMTEAIGGPAPDLVTLYLPGLDIAQHTLLGRDATPLPASAMAARVDALRAYYVFLDRLLRPSLTPSRDELVFVVTQPGRVASPAAGTLAVTGGPARADARLAGSLTDVAPTILYALGVPHARDLAGRALRELFAQAFVSKYPVREIATYGAPSMATAPRSGQPLDEEMLERLRSLGYVR